MHEGKRGDDKQNLPGWHLGIDYYENLRRLVGSQGSKNKLLDSLSSNSWEKPLELQAQRHFFPPSTKKETLVWLYKTPYLIQLSGILRSPVMISMQKKTLLPVIKELEPSFLCS